MNLRSGVSLDPALLNGAARICRTPEGYAVKVKRLVCASSCRMLLREDETGDTETIDAAFWGPDGDRDVYRCSVSPAPGLYFLCFRLETADGVFYLCRGDDDESGVLRSEPDGEWFPLSVCTPAPGPDPAFADGNMYHVFVDRFRIGNKVIKKDGARYDPDWEHGIPEYGERPGDELPNNTFFGGNLYGIAEKLERIRDLGCTILYLSPIFTAASNHKYDTGDYHSVDPGFGGDEAFAALCEKAHALGMKVILDGVFNHTGDDSIYFNRKGTYGDGGAYNDPDSPYHNWYTFRSFPDDYECWWGVKVLPRLNGTDREVCDFFCGENGVVRRWLRAGADGWRLDVADELSEEMMERIKPAAETEKPGALILGEVWEDASVKIAYGKRRHYFTRAQLDSVMNYPLREAVIRYVKTGDAAEFAAVFRLIQTRYPKRVQPFLMNFLGTHDTERILTVLGGDPAEDRGGSALAAAKMTPRQYRDGVKRLIFAFALLCCCPGIACVYYGDEAGMEGYRDPFNRLPYPWGREDPEVYAAFRDLLHFRKTFAGSDARLLLARDGWILLRRGEWYCLFRNGTEAGNFCLGGVYTDRDGVPCPDPLSLPPLSFRFFRAGDPQKRI